MSEKRKWRRIGLNPHRLEGNIAYIGLRDRIGNITAEAMIDSSRLEQVLNFGPWHQARNQEQYSYARSGRTFLHRFIMNSPEGMAIDHINGNGLDCRAENLRVISHWENSKYQRVFRLEAMLRQIVECTSCTGPNCICRQQAIPLLNRPTIGRRPVKNPTRETPWSKTKSSLQKQLQDVLPTEKPTYLSQLEWDALVCHIVEKMSYADIGRILEMTEAGVRMAAKRAAQKLQMSTVVSKEEQLE